VLSPLDKLERPPSLVALQAAISARMPKIDLQVYKEHLTPTFGTV
jgi:hypothetical protein